jgi:hypothetical protein
MTFAASVNRATDRAWLSCIVENVATGLSLVGRSGSAAEIQLARHDAALTNTTPEKNLPDFIAVNPSLTISANLSRLEVSGSVYP